MTYFSNEQVQMYTFYQNILSIVAKEAEIEPSLILSKCRECEIVDARHIFINLLHSNGYTISRIVRLTGFAKSTVANAIDNFENRRRFSGFIFNDTLRRCIDAVAKCS